MTFSPASSSASAAAGGVTVIETVSVTASVTVSGTNAATANDVAALTARVYTAATVYRIECYAPSVAPGTTAASRIDVILKDAATDLGILARIEQNSGTVTRFGPFYAVAYVTGDGASHTYKFSAYRVTSDGSVACGAGGAGTLMPAYIRLSSGA